ncbi:MULTISPECIES: hypothetical protein [unclassified Butyrivibrio]|uniref:hypothetical protein n=1 Tax=unclassified Butyrivibrio TaxID=2639466 RepID=UPI0003B3BCC0|nr:MULTISPECIES: hypothetical protein [unclassified Butyrivibrio]SEL18504.1 hypothetical protein SAMN04487770_10710 [Butyrivibrio sp. ob235]
MNQSLYDAVFCVDVGGQKIDPFAAATIDFGKVISDMKLGGYEITSLHVAEFMVLHFLDDLRKIKNQIITETMDLPNKEEVCRENYGMSFKDIHALEPTKDIEFDLKSGQVLLFLSNDAQYMEDAYMKLFGQQLNEFCQNTGFIYTKLGEAL